MGLERLHFHSTITSSWAIDILAENDYMYDSSIVPAKTSMYGLPGAEQESPYKISSKNIETT